MNLAISALFSAAVITIVSCLCKGNKKWRDKNLVCAEEIFKRQVVRMWLCFCFVLLLVTIILAAAFNGNDYTEKYYRISTSMVFADIEDNSLHTLNKEDTLICVSIDDKEYFFSDAHGDMDISFLQDYTKGTSSKIILYNFTTNKTTNTMILSPKIIHSKGDMTTFFISIPSSVKIEEAIKHGEISVLLGVFPIYDIKLLKSFQCGSPVLKFFFNLRNVILYLIFSQDSFAFVFGTLFGVLYYTLMQIFPAIIFEKYDDHMHNLRKT